MFLPSTAPAVKVDRLRTYGADVRLSHSEYADALIACTKSALASGALTSHAYDHPYIAAGAGTLMIELQERIPDLDTVAVEPENCRALNAALGRPPPCRRARRGDCPGRDPRPR